MNAHDWVDWSNWWIGALGLVLTLITLCFAKGARTAAREARTAVHRRNSADELTGLRGLANEFSTALRNGKDDIALHVASTFISECSALRERHREFLRQDGANLDTARELVADAMTKLQRGKTERPILLKNAQQVVMMVSGVSGVMDRKAEQEQR